MENSLGYSKKLCMSELRVLHTHYTSAHYYDAGAGRVNSSFVYLFRGEVTLSTVGKEIHMGAGSLFYIPEGIRYHSVWHGTPDVEFYTLEIISKPSAPKDDPADRQSRPTVRLPPTRKSFGSIGPGSG